MSSEILLSSQQNSHIPITSLFIKKELVGKGAYGGVYKGIHVPTGLVVALKVIDLDTADDDISEIQKEVALLSEMRDANKYNITLYHGCYLNKTELWIAMDFASGGSIRTLMKSGKIEEKYIVLIVREVLIALSFLHKQGIIHRDVKAANVLLTQNGKILLCDFGVAAHLQTNNKRSTFIGTPLWMAPEVITDGKLYDTKADIWSLGVTLYEIATGNPPYFGMEPLRACALIPRSAPSKLEGGAWTPSMREFLGLCLQTDPAGRPTADELSRTKWIKSASKLSMILLRELIARYLAWVQTGGQRASLAGMDMLAREDTFEMEEDLWDFDGENDDTLFAEPLGDEPPRSLDQQAAFSSVRPPKTAAQLNQSRSHHLLRLFDADTSSATAANSYSNILSSFATGPASNGMDTIRPTISIPSFEEMDEMSSSTKFNELPNEFVAPVTIRPAVAPFAWSVPRSSSPSSYITTPTESNFPDLSSSPSLPSLAADRPFLGNRSRSNTAPSSDYPPLGPGIPSTFSSHSNNNSLSSVNSTSLFSSISSGSSVTQDSPPSIRKLTTNGNGSNGGFNKTISEAAAFGNVNRPFRSRTTSDAVVPASTSRLRSVTNMENNGNHPSNGSGSRSRGGEGRPAGLHPKHGIKLQISTNLEENPRQSIAQAQAQLSSETPTNLVNGGYHNPFDLPTPTSATFGSNENSNSIPVIEYPFPSDLSHQRSVSFEEPDQEDQEEGDLEEEEEKTGPKIRPLNYGELVTDLQVHQELELVLGELGEWLEVVLVGLGDILEN